MAIIEIARNNGDDVVWQFVNLQQDGLAGEVFDGLRFAEDEARFCRAALPLIGRPHDSRKENC